MTGQLERWLPRILGGSALLNSGFVPVLAILAFAGSSLIFEPQGIGPSRIAAADIFRPHEHLSGWMLMGIRLGLGFLSWGLFRRRRAAISVIRALMGLASVRTLIAIVWGWSAGQPGVVISGAMKVTLYAAVFAMLLSGPVRRAFDR